MTRSAADRRIFLVLATLLAVSVVASACIGSFRFTPAEALRYLLSGLGFETAAGDPLARSVFLSLRLPRVLLAGAAGAILGVSGALMQGLFRNPIVEPGLAGTSAGAALGASLVFVLGGHNALALSSPLRSVSVPAAAFAGGLLATLVVYRVSSAFGKVNVFTLLLTGIAVNALAAAGTGFLSYVARDPQARNIVFWNLGTFTTADWQGGLLVTAGLAIGYGAVALSGKSLNALMLGDEEAASLGVDPGRLTIRLLVAVTLMVALATAMVGVIAFVGLVVPHLLRQVRSSDYRFLVPASALLGAALMETVDVVARVVLSPAELPIGIITAVVGAPIFLVVLLRQRSRGGILLDG